MLATHFEHIVNAELTARNEFFGVSEMFVLLVEFAEFAFTTRFSPEVFCKGVDQAVLVVDRNTIGAVGRECIHNERARCKVDHLFRDIDIGAKGIPTGGVVKNIVMVAFNQ